MNPYEQKKQERIQRYRRRAEQSRREGTVAQNRANSILSIIPPGQPILVGHHSEKRHRSDLRRVDNAMRKSIEAGEKAKYWEERALSAETNRTVYSDDPEAIEKLKEKADELEAKLDRWREWNKLIRKNDREGLAALGLSQAAIDKLFVPDCMGIIGFPKYVFANGRANVRRMRERIKDLEARGKQETTEKEIGRVRVVENVEENRVQLFYPGKPDDATRKHLKSHGFRWSPQNGCWQRHLTYHATQLAVMFAQEYEKQQ